MIVKILMTKPLPSLDTEGIVTQKSFGTFEKQAPGMTQAK